jgi:uncharacterized protein (DUF305 family)
MRFALPLAAILAVAGNGAAVAHGQPGWPDAQPDAQVDGAARAARPDSEPETMDDASYVRMMLMHHQRGVRMGELALDRAQRPDVRAFATRVVRDQQQDIRELERIQKTLPASAAAPARRDRIAGQAAEQSPGVRTMPGMESRAGTGREAEQSLERLSADAFDDAFIRSMLAHHRKAIEMSTPATRFVSPEVRTFAGALVERQSRDVKELEAMRGRS